MRLAVVTSQFPVDQDPTRGRPIAQTVASLSRYVDLAVFVPNAVYPKWFPPRSYTYVPPAGQKPAESAIEVHYVGYPTFPQLGRPLNGTLAGRALRDPITSFAPDVVLSYWLYPDAYGAATVARDLGVPLVSGARGSDIRARDALTIALTRRVLARSQHVLTVSDNLREIVTGRFRVSPAKVTSIPNGCDASLFKLGSRSVARQKLGLPESDRLILYVGRLVAAKGLRELVAAFALLDANSAGVRLALVGQGALLDELSASAHAAGCGNRIHFPGQQLPAGVATWMQASDVICLPSHTEGYPNVLVEALACGRPVVATPVGGILEIVDETNGILSPVGNEKALSKALSMALKRNWDEVSLSAKFSRSWDDVARETIQVCENAGNRPGF